MPILLLLLGVATLAVVSANAGYKKPPLSSLDANMPPDLRNQVLGALVNETDPSRLEALAGALAPLYPIASSQLRAKANALRSSLPFPSFTPPPVGLLEIGSLPEPTRSQVLQQIATGSDPAALEAFASQLEARSPAAASALRLRASMLRNLSALPPISLPTSPPISPAATSVPPPVPDFTPPAPPPPPLAPPPSPPPPASSAPSTPAAPLPSLSFDPGMPPDVAQAVTNALAREMDPVKLRGFAASIAKFPIAAGLLMAKANTLAFVTPPSPLPAPIPTAPSPIISIPSFGTYVVLPGDFPIKIAQKLVHDGNRWTELVATNPNKKRAPDGNFASLLPGEVLQLPATWSNVEAVHAPTVSVVPSATANTYVVLPGDFPIKIAKKIVHDEKRWPELVAANPAKKRAADGNFVSLQPGEKLQLPASWVLPSGQTPLLLNPGGPNAASA